MRDACDMPEHYARDMLAICSRYARDMLDPARDMPERYARDMLEPARGIVGQMPRRTPCLLWPRSS